MTKRNEWIAILQKCLEDFVRDFPKNVEQAKKDYTEKVKQITGTAMETAKRQAGHINNNISSILVGLNAIESPTAMEVTCLSENLAGMYYYTDRKLASMASKVGLKAHYRPEVGESLKLIKQIEDKTTNFIKEYTGKENLDIVLVEIAEIAKKL